MSTSAKNDAGTEPTTAGHRIVPRRMSRGRVSWGGGGSRQDKKYRWEVAGWCSCRARHPEGVVRTTCRALIDCPRVADHMRRAAKAIWARCWAQVGVCVCFCVCYLVEWEFSLARNDGVYNQQGCLAKSAIPSGWDCNTPTVSRKIPLCARWVFRGGEKKSKVWAVRIPRGLRIGQQITWQSMGRRCHH